MLHFSDAKPRRDPVILRAEQKSYTQHRAYCLLTSVLIQKKNIISFEGFIRNKILKRQLITEAFVVIYFKKLNKNKL